jgi:dihydrofolate reductase
VRKIVAGLFISLDGVIEDANDWTGPWFNEEVGQAVGSMIAAQDAMLLGRVTYDGFAAHWPQQTGELADTMNGTAKYVVSDTLESADWRNSTLIRRDRAAAEIAELKQRPGQNIGMTGSATLVAWLLREGLLDELRLLVFPVVLGSGKRLFATPGDKLPLRLIDSATFETGVVRLTYAKA